MHAWQSSPQQAEGKAVCLRSGRFDSTPLSRDCLFPPEQADLPWLWPLAVSHGQPGWRGSLTALLQRDPAPAHPQHSGQPWAPVWVYGSGMGSPEHPTSFSCLSQQAGHASQARLAALPCSKLLPPRTEPCQSVPVTCPCTQETKPEPALLFLCFPTPQILL